jgi:mycofactocin biosynthesis protein MftB
MSPIAFDLARPWALDPHIALRPEPFGALAYDFTTRRLSFLKTRALLEVVRTLGEHGSARDACVAAGIPDEELPRYADALAALAKTGMVRPRETS